MDTVTPRQTATSRAVRQYMDREHLTLAEMGGRLGMATSTVHSRLHGVRRWTADDLDVLVLLGVEVPELGAVDAPRMSPEQYEAEQDGYRTRVEQARGKRVKTR